MKLVFKGHDYKYAAEQMLLAHGMCHPAGDPGSLICAGGVNPPGIKILLRKMLGPRHLARKGQQREVGWCL